MKTREYVASGPSSTPARAELFEQEQMSAIMATAKETKDEERITR